MCCPSPSLWNLPLKCYLVNRTSHFKVWSVTSSGTSRVWGHTFWLPGMWSILLAYNIFNFWLVYQDNPAVNGWTFVYCNPLHCKMVSVAIYKPYLDKSILKMQGAWLISWNNLPHRATVMAPGLSMQPALPAYLNLLPTQTGEQRASPFLLLPTTPHTISDLRLGTVRGGWWILSCASLPDWEL